MPQLVPPHASEMIRPLLVPESAQAEALERAETLLKVPITSREVSDLLMLGMGAYTPLAGFMGEGGWRSVCADMKLANGVFWPIPITLSTSQELADQISIGEEVALCDGQSGDIMAIMSVGEKYSIDKEFECTNVYRTTDPAHPGVQKVLEQGVVNLGGPVSVLSEGEYPEKYADLYLRPEQSRALFIEKGWSRVAAFQTRNPMHRSHEYLAKIAVEVTDGVFIHSAGHSILENAPPEDGRTKAVRKPFLGF